MVDLGASKGIAFGEICRLQDLLGRLGRRGADQWMDGWMDGWMNGLDGWFNLEGGFWDGSGAVFEARFLVNLEGIWGRFLHPFART